ncbi:pirin family protein [Zunongwangia sp.]|uniref:pirin family protein n=1 Tax=Zunongwangia sp. TaxID=1965325 RepID=UPI003AA80B6F
METIFHKASKRGSANFGWLNAHYSFSFANYFNPEKMNFGLLRVLNDDLVAPGKGFPTHPHKNMEIISIPLAGTIQHKDSMGNSSEIKSGEVQVMSAGAGVEHSEWNPGSETLNLLQIWIFTAEENTKPRYDQKNFKDLLEPNKLVPLVTPKDKQKEDSLFINQNAFLSMGNFEKGINYSYLLNENNNGIYLFLIEGEITVDGQLLHKRDAIGCWDTKEVKIDFNTNSKLLVIEVPMN